MYAIIDDSGKQFRVTSGDRIRIDREVDEGTKSVTFDRVLLVGGAGDAKVGSPLVEGCDRYRRSARAIKGPKVYTVKYRRRKGFHKKIGIAEVYGSKDHGINA